MYSHTDKQGLFFIVDSFGLEGTLKSIPQAPARGRDIFHWTSAEDHEPQFLLLSSLILTS